MTKLVAIVMVAMLGSARADRRAAEDLAQAAEATKDPAAFDACGQAYLDAFTAAPAQPQADELLFNAGTCYEAGHSVGEAQQAFEKLRATQPRSRLDVKALAHLVRIAQDTGRFADAAAGNEEYAKRYTGEKDAADALASAIAVRMVLGNDAEAIEDTRFFVRTFGTRRSDDAAAAMLGLVAIYEKQGRAAAIVHVRELLRDRQLSDAQRAIAQAKLGELMWDQSCKGRALCVTELPTDKVARCAAATRLRVDRRSGDKEAIGALELAAKLYENHPVEDVGARHAYAMAKLRIADRALETYLGTAYPAGLDFSAEPRHRAGKDASLARFQAWVTARQQLGAAAQRSYEALLAVKDPEASLAATARIGQISASFAAALRGADIPKDVRTGEFATEKTAAFCDKLTEVAEPLAARASEAFDICRAKAAELGIDSPWTALCRREALALAPKRVFDEPRLPPLVPSYPLPGVAPAPRPTPTDPPAYAGLVAQVETADRATLCGAIATKLKSVTDASERYLAAIVAQRCHREPEARQIWQTLAGAPALASLGSLDWSAGDRTSALELWRRALAQDGKLAVAHYGIALAQFDDLARETEVERALRSAHVLDGDVQGPPVMLALLELRRGHPQLARLQLARIHGEFAQLRVVRAVLAVGDGLWSAAIEPLEAAATERLPQATYDLALVELRQHRFDAALAHLHGVPSGYGARVATGVALAGTGKAAEAQGMYRSAIQLDAARPEAHFDLGLALATDARYAAAADELELAGATGLAAHYRALQ